MAVDRFGRMVVAEWRRGGGRIDFLRQKKRGDHLRVTWPAKTTGSGQILVLGHLDTVYELGTLGSMPFLRGAWPGRSGRLRSI